MRNRKGILTIILLAALLFFVPTNTKAYNSAPAFKCFYTTKVTEGNTDVTYTIKLLYVDGQLEAVKYKTSRSGLPEIQMKPSEFERLESNWFKKINTVGNSCPESFTLNDGYWELKNYTAKGDTYRSFKKNKDHKSHTYKLTASGTQKVGSGTVIDKDCNYKNSDGNPATIKVHYYRTKYLSSYAEDINGVARKMEGFWWNGKKDYTFLADSHTTGVVTLKGYYDSIHNYIEKYSSKPNVCPEKIFYDSKNGVAKWYAATGDVKDNQNEDEKNTLINNDHNYTIYKLDKGKICKENLNKTQEKMATAESKISTLENELKNDGDWDFTTANTRVVEYENITSLLDEVDSLVNGCDKEEGYQDIIDRAKKASDKLVTIRKDLKSKIRSSNLTDDEKSALAKRIDSSYRKLVKLSSMDLSVYGNPQDCGTILGDVEDEDSLAYLIQKLLNYIKIIGPILVVILSSIDFIKVIWASDDENMKKAQQKLVKRLIAALLLFLLPTLIGLMITLINNSVVDPTCGIQ